MRTLLIALLGCAQLQLAYGGGNTLPPTTSKESLSRLKDGNHRYTSGSQLRPHQDKGRRSELAQGQNPFAAIISCADSRVCPELMFDQGLGDLFVVRVAGNVASVAEIGSVEYAAEHLHVPLLVILGHTKCGAVAAAVEGAELHGCLGETVNVIRPAVDKVKAVSQGAPREVLVAKSVYANVWSVMEAVLTRSAPIRELVERGQLNVLGAVYELETGTVNWLGNHPEQQRLLARAASPDSAGHGTPTAHPAQAVAAIPTHPQPMVR